jgi:putative hydrolase
MADLPGGFGFNPPDRPGDDSGSGSGGSSGGGFGFGNGGSGGAGDDPFAAMFGGGGFDPSKLGEAFQQIGRMLDYEGAVNWKLVDETSRQALSAAGGGDVVTDADRSAVTEAVRLAELWLDSATVFPAAGTTATAWTRQEWLDRTRDGWRELVEPLALRAVDAMGSSMPESMPPEVAAMAGPLAGMFKQLGGAMFGSQVGQGLGQLAREVLGASDVGVPLAPVGAPALVPANVTAFGAGLDVADDEVRLYVALREAAHQRLFVHAPWLRSTLVAAVDEYARGMRVDTSALEEQLGSFDMSDPAALQAAVQSGMFEPADTEEQKAALARLETLLALIEGWVDAVVADAATSLPSADRLRETMRRRRATGGPAERTFATLVGLELRPRRVRDAAALWVTLREQRGIDGRDATWAHPDLLPNADDLDDVDGFVARASLDLSGLDDLPAAPEEDGGAAPA